MTSPTTQSVPQSTRKVETMSNFPSHPSFAYPGVADANAHLAPYGIEAVLEIDAGGWHVLWFRKADEARSYWYGTREECLARVAEPVPHRTYWHRSEASR